MSHGVHVDLIGNCLHRDEFHAEAAEHTQQVMATKMSEVMYVDLRHGKRESVRKRGREREREGEREKERGRERKREREREADRKKARESERERERKRERDLRRDGRGGYIINPLFLFLSSFFLTCMICMKGLRLQHLVGSCASESLEIHTYICIYTYTKIAPHTYAYRLS